MARATEENDLVSIVLPVFNAENFLAEAIASVQWQTHPHWEILAVLDPLSRDNSARILADAVKLDNRIRILRAPYPGPGIARNVGLDSARGRWICFLDADDVWLNNKLERQLHWMREWRLPFSATRFRRIDAKAERTGRLIPWPVRLTKRRLLKQNVVCCSSVMLDRKQVGKVRFKDIGCEDFDLWLRLTAKGREGFGIQEDLVRYRIHGAQRGRNKWKTARESWALLRAHGGALGFGGFIVRGAFKYGRF